MSWTEPTTSKVQLLWIHTFPNPICLLSLPLLRELCLYLGPSLFLLPSISHNLLRIYDLKERTVSQTRLKIRFTKGAVCVVTEKREVIVVGGWPAEGTVYSIKGSRVVWLESMKVSRAYPGMYYWRGQIYIFGGNNPAIRTCEKLGIDRHWLYLPNMTYERYAFNPCFRSSNLLLIDTYQEHRVCESFNLISEQFQVLSYDLPSDSDHSISYITDKNELIVISASGNFYIWTSNNGVYRKELYEVIGSSRVSCTCPVVRYGEKVYFTNCEQGKLGCFSRETKRMQPVTNFTLFLP